MTVSLPQPDADRAGPGGGPDEGGASAVDDEPGPTRSGPHDPPLLRPRLGADARPHLRLTVAARWDRRPPPPPDRPAGRQATHRFPGRPGGLGGPGPTRLSARMGTGFRRHGLGAECRARPLR